MNESDEPGLSKALLDRINRYGMIFRILGVAVAVVSIAIMVGGLITDDNGNRLFLIVSEDDVLGLIQFLMGGALFVCGLYLTEYRKIIYRSTRRVHNLPDYDYDDLDGMSARIKDLEKQLDSALERIADMERDRDTGKKE